MLQQTTSRAVIPFFERFLERFPAVSDLAGAPIGDVLEMWAGLGYYSRARNLHRAANQLVELGHFPTDVEQLLSLPGFGPYTARAVSSLAFETPVGVVDGNTIRVMSRFLSWQGEWWKPKGRNEVQTFMDDCVRWGQPSKINQAMMELGATICTPQSPTCLLCPVKKSCTSFSAGTQIEFPARKPKKDAELWFWQPEIWRKGKKLALIKNIQLPFLKGQWMLPGKGQKIKEKPKQFGFQHSITHYKIFVSPKNVSKMSSASAEVKWVETSELKKWCPMSLVDKALYQVQSDTAQK